MSVRPLAFHPNGQIDYWHDEESHGGTVQIADLQHPSGLNGVDDRFLILPCQCGTVSIHPISGGADPDRIQALFALKRATAPANRNKPFATILQEVADATAALDGPGRFKLAGVTRGHIEDGTTESPVETMLKERQK